MEDKARSAIVLGKRAQALLEDDLLHACFEALKQDFVGAWCNATSPEDRELIWCKQAVLGEVKQKLITLIGSGKVAERKLQN